MYWTFRNYVLNDLYVQVEMEYKELEGEYSALKREYINIKDALRFHLFSIIQKNVFYMISDFKLETIVTV